MKRIEFTPILERLTSIFPQSPEICVVLGSGLGAFANRLEGKRIIPTSEIPNYPQSTVKGHEGAVVSGIIAGRRLLCFQGRIHLYEGYKVEEVILPIQIAYYSGAKILILTNAAGGINPKLRVGSFMLISDHLDFQFQLRVRPEKEVNPEKEIERLPFYSHPFIYSERLREIAQITASSENIEVFAGVLGAVSGPTYETPAEVRMLKKIGVDAACMSTVAEASEGARLGMEVLGISCISNRAAGLKTTPLSHAEVIRTSKMMENQFTRLLEGFISRV